MRKYPEFKDVMPILDQPSCLALIKMITCFRKFNFELEDTHLNDIVAFDQGGLPSSAANELLLSNESTVMLMQHIIRELTHVYKEFHESKRALQLSK